MDRAGQRKIQRIYRGREGWSRREMNGTRAEKDQSRIEKDGVVEKRRMEQGVERFSREEKTGVGVKRMEFMEQERRSRGGWSREEKDGARKRDRLEMRGGQSRGGNITVREGLKSQEVQREQRRGKERRIRKIDLLIDNFGNMLRHINIKVSRG